MFEKAENEPRDFQICKKKLGNSLHKNANDRKVKIEQLFCSGNENLGHKISENHISSLVPAKHVSAPMLKKTNA